MAIDRTTVTHRLIDPSADPVQRGGTITLGGFVGGQWRDIQGMSADGQIITHEPADADGSGEWTVELIPNSAITPANTLYRYMPAQGQPVVFLVGEVSPSELKGLVVTDPSQWPSMTPTVTGPAGDDAYEVAVAEGFEGTRPEWLASLVGPPNVLTKGTATTGPAGGDADFSITGDAPHQVLNLILPRGDVTQDALNARDAAQSAAATAIAAAASLGNPAAVGLTHTGVAWYEVGAVSPDTYQSVDVTGADTQLLSGGNYVRQSQGTPMLPAVQSRMRRCVVKDDGTGVVYYLDADDSTKIAGTWDSGSRVQTGWVRVWEGVLDPVAPVPGQTSTESAVLRSGVPAYSGTAYYRRGDRVIHDGKLWDSLADQLGVVPSSGTEDADLTGSDGQVMVEIPAFYYRMDYDAALHRHCWEVVFDTRSYQTFPVLTEAAPLLDSIVVAGRGFQLHPWFTKAGIKRKARYRSAFHAIAENTGNNGTGKLLSISDGASTNTTNVGNTNFRLKARNRNAGLTDLSGEANNVWSLYDYWGWHALMLLYITEYRTLYSQSAMGLGGGNSSGGDYNKVAGRTVPMGNGSGVTDSSGVAQVPNTGDFDAMSYRGIEDWFASAYQWTDGWNVRNGAAGQEHYVSRTPADWAYATAAGYDLLCVTPTGIDNWRYPSGLIGGTFMGNVFSGSTSTYLTDGNYANAATDNSWRVPRVGGDAGSGGSAGAAALALGSGVGSAHVVSGAALIM